MLFNVWVPGIWAEQQKILCFESRPTDEEKPRRAPHRVSLAARPNTMLSLPMLLLLAPRPHGLPFLGRTQRLPRRSLLNELTARYF